MRKRCRAVLGLAFLAAAAAGIPTLAARPQMAASQPPVTVAFRAFTDAGDPLLNLKASDLTLKVNGRVRPIASLDLIRFSAHAPGATRPALPSPFAANVTSDLRRRMLLVIEDESIAPGREDPIKSAVRQLLASLAPADEVALLTTPRAGMISEFSTNHDAVRTQAAAFAGHASIRESSADLPCRTLITLDALQRLFAGLPADPPVTVVFFSGGLSGPIDSLPALSAPQPLCELRLDNFHAVADAVLATNSFFYVVHVVEGSGSASSLSSQLSAGVESLASDTGAVLMRATGGNVAALERIARETESYYALTLVPEPSDARAPRLRLELRAGRDGTKLLAPPEVVRGRARGSRTAGFSPREMLTVPDTARDLPLRAGAYCSRNPGDPKKVKLVVLFEAAEASTSLRSAALGLFDEKGKLVAQSTGEGDDLNGRPAASALAAPPGRYRLRVAAADASGRVGTVDQNVTLGLSSAGALSFSDLVLGTGANGRFAPRLVFSDEASVMGYFEIYGLPKDAAATVTLRLSESENGAPMGTADAAIRVSAGDPDMRLALAGFPLESLPAGDYLLRATLTVDGKPVGSTARTLRKAAR